jgi:hypothetical protein
VRHTDFMDRGDRCAKCAASHPGAVDKRSKKCEDCGLKWPSFGQPGESGVGLVLDVKVILTLPCIFH